MGVDRECPTIFLMVSRFYGNFVETDTSSMLIMVLAHAQASGSRELIEAYVRPTVCSTSFVHKFNHIFRKNQYPLLKKWGDYLVDNAFALGTGQQ